MPTTTRREFMGQLGRGLALAGLGASVFPASALARLAGDETLLDFGPLEPLVARMQETLPERLQQQLVDELRAGTPLDRLVAAGALANARTFGGESYNGYHAFMALIPALEMAYRLPEDERALPVLKVLYRNATFMQDSGGRAHEVLRPVTAFDDGTAPDVRQALRDGDVGLAEQRFATVCRGTPLASYDALQPTIRDDIDVHRIVLAWRSWDMLSLVGTEHAHTMLRQSLRHCVSVERNRLRRGKAEPALRELLPALLEEHGLTGGATGTRPPDDARVAELARTIFGADRADAAGAMASALAEGFAPAALGESLSLVGNQLLLHDPGRTSGQPGKPVGSVHGASVGLHASDAARAWRDMLNVVSPAHATAGLVVGAYHAGGQSQRVGREPFPWRERLDELAGRDAAALLDVLGRAIEANDQALACAAVQRRHELGASEGPVLDLLLRASLEADGALHAEKYFSTVTQELGSARPAFRQRHLLGLARVAASQHGHAAPGLDAARELLSA